jgi:hypothetical protein
VLPALYGLRRGGPYKNAKLRVTVLSRAHEKRPPGIARRAQRCIQSALLVIFGLADAVKGPPEGGAWNWRELRSKLAGIPP